MSAERTTRDEPSLELRLQVRPGPAGPVGTARLLNLGRSPIRVWRSGNEWGDTALSFELRRDDGSWPIRRAPQVYTRNVPSALLLPLGYAHEVPFELRDGEWEAEVALDQLVSSDELVAIYRVPSTAEATEHGVWSGELRSDPVPLGEPEPGGGAERPERGGAS